MYNVNSLSLSLSLSLLYHIALRRQSNLNFAAVFYTLNQTLSSYLKDYLDSAFNDHFLHFFHIPDHFANDHIMPLEVHTIIYILILCLRTLSLSLLLHITG